MKDSFFSGKNILLTGATGGIGSAIARDLAAAGANLCCLPEVRKNWIR